MLVDSDLRGQQGTEFFTGGSVIMDYGSYFIQRWHFNDRLFLQTSSFSLHKTLLDLCGLLVDYHVLLTAWSFWRHPFTAENPLMSKWCKAKFLQICSDEETNSSTTWMAWGSVHFRPIFIFGELFLSVILNISNSECSLTLRPKQAHLIMCLQVVCVSSRVSGMLASLQREWHSNYQNTACVFVDRGRSDTNKTNGTFHKRKHAPYVAALKNWFQKYIQQHIPALKSLLYINAVLKLLQSCSTVKKTFGRKENPTPGLQTAKNNYRITRIQ